MAGGGLLRPESCSFCPKFALKLWGAKEKAPILSSKIRALAYIEYGGERGIRTL